MGGLFPYSQCCSCNGHEGAFLWSNIGNLTNFLSGIVYIVGWLVIIVLAVIGIFFPPIWILIPVPAFIWFAFDSTALGLQTVGGVFHFISCLGDEGAFSAFVTFNLSRTGVCCMSMYNCIAHWVALGLLWLGVGVFVLFGPYFFSGLFFVFAIMAKKD